jgi:hypothetical protein
LTEGKRAVKVPGGVQSFVGRWEGLDRSTLSAAVQRLLVSPAIAAIAMRQAGYLRDATKDG